MNVDDAIPASIPQLVTNIKKRIIEIDQEREKLSEEKAQRLKFLEELDLCKRCGGQGNCTDGTVKCAICNGSGKQPKNGLCCRCEGAGEIRDRDEERGESYTFTCPTCNGSGLDERNKARA